VQGKQPPRRVTGGQQHQREFAEFYAATRDDCLRIVLLTAGDRLLAEDLVAEAYTRAWLSWRKVRALHQHAASAAGLGARRPGAVAARCP
jgi:DNA-directed RNA polymerase specialized sigma24 family protein